MEPIKEFYQLLEDGISRLNETERGALYRPCAVNCVKDTVLLILRKRFEECDGDMDIFFSEKYDSEYSYQKVIQKGHIYEFGYPKCFCPLTEAEFVKSAVHCECSRQSILYVLQTLLPDKNIQVTTLYTVLSGAKECRFNIVIK